MWSTPDSLQTVVQYRFNFTHVQNDILQGVDSSGGMIRVFRDSSAALCTYDHEKTYKNTWYFL